MKLKRNHVYISVIILIILMAGILYFKPFTSICKSPLFSAICPQKPKDTSEEKDKVLWVVDKNGYLYYPSSRENPKFRRDDYSQTDDLFISKVVYQSTRGNVYGLLVMPKSVSNQLPGVVLLPGAGVGKESELPLAKKIAELGAVVLTIDQRGVGETDGTFPSLDEDYSSFLNAKEPYQHLMVYDALRAYDLLYSASFVDPDRIIIAGESLGGRVAIIAAAIDKNIKGVIVISSAGFDFKDKGDPKKDAFIKSIDSDHYIDQIAPRKLVMIHNAYDRNIPLGSALASYEKAQEPKRFILVNDTSCNHGYCSSMYDGLIESLDYLVDIHSKTLFKIPDKK